MMPPCIALQPDMAELHGDIVAHWWEQNGAAREALRELAFGSSTPEGLERQIAFEELVRQLQDESTKAGSPGLARCCAQFMTGLAAGREPAATSGGLCAVET